MTSTDSDKVESGQKQRPLKAIRETVLLLAFAIVLALVVLQLLATLLVIVLRSPGYAQAGFGLGLAAVVLYVLRGWSVSGTGARGLLDLALAPFYVGWKIMLRFRKPPRATAEWVRTKREAGRDAPP